MDISVSIAWNLSHLFNLPTTGSQVILLRVKPSTMMGNNYKVQCSLFARQHHDHPLDFISADPDGQKIRAQPQQPPDDPDPTGDPIPTSSPGAFFLITFWTHWQISFKLAILISSKPRLILEIDIFLEKLTSQQIIYLRRCSFWF